MLLIQRTGTGIEHEHWEQESKNENIFVNVHQQFLQKNKHKTCFLFFHGLKKV